MEFAIDRFNNSVKFALEHILKASLQLSPYQMNALQSILSGKDTFVCLPTGQGKSFNFECFPHCYDFLHSCESEQSQPLSVLVISPLISLMNSQVHDLRKRNQSALRLLYTVNNTHARLGTVHRAIGLYKVIIGRVTLITQRCELIAIPARPTLPYHAARRIVGRSS